jgi:type I site-specific restriction endonuclease
MLTEQMGIEPVRIAQEYPVEVNRQGQRADIVVFGAEGRPLMVIECKAPEVPVSEAVLAQAFRYNSVLGAPYVMLTNGLCHYISTVSEGGE